MALKYRMLADQLREEMRLQDWKAGRRLPTETELTARFGVSRQTVRKALQVLAEEGVVQSRQGSGTYTTGNMGGGSRQVAVVSSFLDDYIFPTVLHDAQSVFTGQGYSTLVFATENQVSREREILQGALAAGWTPRTSLKPPLFRSSCPSAWTTPPCWAIPSPPSPGRRRAS